MTAFARSIDTILWGRKTYDFAAKMWGVGAYGKVKHYAFSRQPPSDPLPGVDFVSESIPEFVGKLQAVRGKNIMDDGRCRDHRVVPGRRRDR